MTGHIIHRDELRRGACLVLWIPWREIEFAALRAAAVAAITQEIDDALSAMADPAEAREAIGASNAAMSEEAA